MSQTLLFNFYTVGWLIFALFCIGTFLICLTIEKKSKSAFHLGLAFLFGGIGSLIYFFSISWYNPASSIHRYFTILFVLANIIHICQFILCFPNESHPRIRKIFLIAMWTIALITVGIFIKKSLIAQHIFHFDGHYWDFALDELSKNIGIIILAYALITIGAGLWRTYIEKGRERWSLLIITVSFIIVTIVPSILNILSRDGALERDLYFLSMNYQNMFGYLIIFMIFINYTKDKNSYKVNVINISFVSILFIVLSISYFSNISGEATYDDQHNKQISRIVADTNFRPKDIEYIIEYSVDQGIVNYNLNKNKIPIKLRPNEPLYTLLLERIKNLPKENFRENLKELLNNSHPYFIGYKNAILEYTDTLNPDKQNSEEIVGYIKNLKRTILYHYNKIDELPLQNFRTLLPARLNKMGKEIKPIKDEIMTVLKQSTHLKDRKLKWRVLRYLDPISPSDERHYRQDRLRKGRFVAFTHIDISANKIYEVGFSYLEYRKFIHPYSLKLIVLLSVIFVGVVTIIIRLLLKGHARE